MEKELEIIRDQQKDSWNKFSPGWKKWDGMMMEFLKPLGDEIINTIKPQGKQKILDIASGTGEPGISIAKHLQGGKVVLTDLSEDMLKVAKENAEKQQVKNTETKVCDVSELPFPDNTFDAVSCRLGFMFFPDIPLATSEMIRVLKPGGKLVTAVWNSPDKNFWVTVIMGAIKRHLEIPAPLPNAPGMFRCAGKGMIHNLFSRSGLKNVGEKEIGGKLNCKTAYAYWTLMNEVGAPIVAALSKADAKTTATIKAEVYASLKKRFPDGNVAIDSSALVIWGEK